jgi:hypothetical protein
MGVSLFVAVVYILVNFTVDILYGVVDPRIQWHERPAAAPASLRCCGASRHPQLRPEAAAAMSGWSRPPRGSVAIFAR